MEHSCDRARKIQVLRWFLALSAIGAAKKPHIAVSGLGKAEIYLSEDILQGEDVPFFVRWKGSAAVVIRLSARGFRGISQLHNTASPKEPSATVAVMAEDLGIPGYVGGLLSTQMGEEATMEGQLEVVLEYSDGRAETHVEHRKLHSARLSVGELPASVAVPSEDPSHGVEIEVRGSATVILDVLPLKESEVQIVMPTEILGAYERFAASVTDGFDRLKEEFPQYSSTLDELLAVPENLSMKQYFDYSVAKIETLKHDKSFMEAFALVFVSAMIGQTSVKDTLFMPLLEYFEASAATKAFLRSPFLSAKIPPGGGTFACELEARDLLGRRCGKSLRLVFGIESEKENMVSLKDLIRFRRVA